MCVDHVKRTDEIFSLQNMVHERPAHVIDFLNEVWLQSERTAVIMNSINALILWPSPPHSCENVNFISFSFESSRQFGDVSGHTSDGNRLKRFPS